MVKDIKPTAEGESQKVKVKVRVNLHGLFYVSSASLYERKDASDEEPDNNESSNGTTNNGQDASTPATEVSPSWSKRLTNWFSSVRIFLN